MEHINYDIKPNIYCILSIKEVAEVLDSTVSVLDTWFPHVSKNIVIRWGQPEFVEYFKTLIVSTRPEPRQGFPLEVLTELGIIADVHNELFPQFKSDLRIFI